MFSAVISDKIITLIAGGDFESYGRTYTNGYNGDNIAANLSALSWPSDIAVSKLGDIYIADLGNSLIRLVTKKTGIITTVAGTPEESGCNGDNIDATSALLNYPRGVAVSVAEDIFISDSDNERIRMVTKSTGIITTIAFISNSGNVRHGIAGIAIGASGNIYVASKEKILLLAKPSWIVSTIADLKSVDMDIAHVQIKYLYIDGVAVDASGNVLITDPFNDRIRMVTKSTGIISTIAGDGFGYDICTPGLYSCPATSIALDDPQSAVFDELGDIYIAEGSKIRKVDVGTGNISTIYQFDEEWKVSHPSAIALDGSGGILVTICNAVYLVSDAPTSAPSAAPTSATPTG